ncbi:MAG: fasciclin domain-containing protein [Deltaproteobacteria bacterium]|nr:fasciclin domain-containing protein [Deltaproteobacteria bacterium]
MNKRLLFTTSIAMGLSTAGCGDDDVRADATTPRDTGSTISDTGEMPTITDLVVESDDFEILEAALLRASPIPGATPTPIADALDAPGAYTVFAPNDAAFESSGLSLSVVANMQPDALRGILLYHGLLARMPASALTDGVQSSIAQLPFWITTEGGVAINGGNTVSGGADVVATDIQASNGVVHVIDRVLLPPTVEAIPRYAGLTTLSGALASQFLTDDLSGPGPFTLFAPTNEAFDALPSLPSGDDLTNALLLHVIDGAVPRSSITSTPIGLSTLAPAPWRAVGSTTTLSLVARLEGGTARVGGVAITMEELPATNGVVHIVGSVLMPANLLEMASAAGLTSLVSAVRAAPAIMGTTTIEGLLSSDSARLTVFGPTNEAFAAVPTLPVGTASRDLLLYHVLASPDPGIVLSTDLPSGAASFPTQLADASVPFAPGPPATIDAQEILIVDLVATNGVLHVVDGVLTPPG